MSEISLRDYFTKLEQLLTTNAADEVIHHCRHILQYYPKNVAAYRYLGRALLVNGRWDEAMAALRRVLSVIPDDYTAHVGLSEIYDHKKKADDAIWHLERAFEQNPNSNELLNGVRALYRRYRDVEQAKVQLTAAAVARQAQRNLAYEHAIDTLRDALERQPDRVDLRLLLGQTLWESGDHVEAAETALDVLQLLPDCLEANRILTQLWLEEDRPSDAQRYLNRVEAIDPYAAVEVAQGQAAPDDAFRLEELDYVRSAQSELTVNRPDWLKDITAEVPQAEQGGQEDWSNFMSSMLASSANAQTQAEEEKPPSDLFGADWGIAAESSTSPAAAEEDEIPSEFAALPSSSDHRDDATTLTPIGSTIKASDSEDPMAWLQGSDIELVDDKFKSPFEEESASIQVDQPDALSWMDDDALSENTGSSSRPMPDAEAFSWMQNYDVELQGDVSTPEPAKPEPAASAEMPDWLNDEGFLDEALGIEQLTGNDAAPEPDWLNLSNSQKQTADLPVPIPPELRPTTPMRDPIQGEEGALPDTDWLKHLAEDEPQAVPGPRRGLTAMLSEANLDWLQEPKPQEEDFSSDEVMDEWLSQFGASEPKAPPAPPNEEPQWLTELDNVMSDEPNTPNTSDQTPDWLSAPTPEQKPELTPIDDEFSWLSSDSEQVSPAEMPDWLSELQPDSSASPAAENSEPANAIDSFDWSASAVEPEAEEAEVSNIPDWMAELEPTSTFQTPSSNMTFEPETSSAEGEFEWLAEDGANAQPPAATSEGEFTWLDEASIDAEAESVENGEAVSADVTPDWLLDLQPQELEFGATPAASSDDQSWLEETNIQTGSSAAVPSETPDWLSELQPQPQTPAAEPVAETDDFGWLDEAEPEAASVEAQPTLTLETPDWLSELQPAPQAKSEVEPEPVSAAANEDLSWLEEAEAEPETQLIEEQSTVAAEVPDWLSELQPQPQTQPQTEAEAASDEFGWLDENESSAEVAGEPAAAADTPDWLSELQPQPQAQPETGAEPIAVASEDLSWLDEVEPEAKAASEEDQPTPTLETPDWLSELQPQPQTPAAAEPVAETDDFGWLDEVEPESISVPEEPAAVAADTPDWLSELQPAPQPQPEIDVEPVAAAETDDFGWLDEVESDDVVDTGSVLDQTLTPATAPEMSSPEPMSVLADDAADEDDYWLNDEAGEMETTTGGVPLEDDINEFEGMTVFPSDEMDMMREENYEPIPASNAPDWLNAMVPGLDVDFEATEDEPVESEFIDDLGAEHPDHGRDFDWVEEIVEEESRQPEIAAAVAEQSARPHFIFSKTPTWLNEPTTPAKRDEELPDWPSDVPDWLR